MQTHLQFVLLKGYKRFLDNLSIKTNPISTSNIVQKLELIEMNLYLANMFLI